MLEMTLLEAYKATERKAVWIADVDGAQFRFYIPQWRIPEPWPSKIFVSVSVADGPAKVIPEHPRKADFETDGSARTKPIEAVVARVESHTKTVRYQQFATQKDEWEIGEPYIPISLIPDGANEFLKITVDWGLASRGKF